jgi:TolA-binding protein
VQVLLNLLALDREQDRAAEAESRLLALVDDPRSPLPQAHVLYELALTQEALGKSDESRATYQRLVDEHPQSPFARTASAELAEAVGAA